MRLPLRICALAASLLSATPLAVSAGCPYLSDSAPSVVPPANHPLYFRTAGGGAANTRVTTSPALDLHLVQNDIKQILTQSQPFWPADFGNYGPFFIRQAWHCAGSYRGSDGHGGCDGGRQRFEPERSWDDNVNLDKAKTLLWPIKQKYGNSLSWGDLIILTANTALESMGAPVLGFCAGRTDDVDGSDSDLLGPTPIQEQLEPCAVNGQCQPPFGTTTIGLIYVNPEGPMGVADPAASAPQVRDAFSRMSMTDVETVALIGGGHTFGKTHGACTSGPGPSPSQDPSNPWPGLCSNGTFTSGFEGQWVSTPTAWNPSRSEYFYNLLNFDWTSTQGPGGHTQWETPTKRGFMMLTTDISLLHDTTFKSIAESFAANITLFGDEFAKAWYKMTSRDMGPASRCIGNLVPPPQPFQNPLPPPSSIQPSWDDVRSAIQKVMGSSSSILPSDSSSYAALFVQLAWSCASTFRSTDYLGGCNGARIRFSPQRDWSINQDMNRVLGLLEPIQQQFADTLSWADLIVFAAQVALEQATTSSSSSVQFSFCPGRSDAVDGTGSVLLSPQLNYSASLIDTQQRAALMGLTSRQLVALSGRLRSPGQMGRLGYSNQTYTSTPNVLSNEYFVQLANNNWQLYTVPSTGVTQYQSTTNPSLFMTPSDLVLRYDPIYFSIVQEYAANKTLFLQEFAQAWTQLMSADRFSGPTSNVCGDNASNSGDNSSSSSKFDLSTPWVAALLSLTIIFGAVAFIATCCYCMRKPAASIQTGDYNRM